MKQREAHMKKREQNKTTFDISSRDGEKQTEVETARTENDKRKD